MSLNDRMNRRMPYSVPQGYFDSLNDRLESIPAKGHGRNAVWKGIATFAVAASLVCGVFYGISKYRLDAEQNAIAEYLIDSGITLEQIYDSLD